MARTSNRHGPACGHRLSQYPAAAAEIQNMAPRGHRGNEGLQAGLIDAMAALDAERWLDEQE